MIYISMKFTVGIITWANYGITVSSNSPPPPTPHKRASAERERETDKKQATEIRLLV